MDLIDELGFRPPWQLDALCRDPAYQHVNFFPLRGEPRDAANDVCSRCLVAAECREYALTMGGDTAGVWAGTSQRERRRLLADREPPPERPR